MGHIEIWLLLKRGTWDTYIRTEMNRQGTENGKIGKFGNHKLFRTKILECWFPNFFFLFLFLSEEYESLSVQAGSLASFFFPLTGSALKQRFFLQRFYILHVCILFFLFFPLVLLLLCGSIPSGFIPVLDAMPNPKVTRAGMQCLRYMPCTIAVGTTFPSARQLWC